MNGLSLALLAALLVLATASPAAPAKPAAGPRGGRLLTQAEPRAELLIGKDRTVSVAFYDAAGKRQAPNGQAVTVIAETPAGPARLELAPKDDLLASPRPLPAGDGYQLVVQLTPAPGAKPRNFRFRLDLSHCSGCQLAEYACYCGH